METNKPRPRVLTQEEQKLSDEATIFVLAGCMMTVHQMMRHRDVTGVAAVINKVGVVLASEPEFISRFKANQKAVMEEYTKLVAPGPKIQVVPS